MRGVVMRGPGDVRVEERERPRIVEPTDAIIRVPASCVCGSDLWPYRGIGERTARLRWVMSTVISNGSRFVLIGGDAGAGKTTIIEALLPTSSDHGPTARPS